MSPRRTLRKVIQICRKKALGISIFLARDAKGEWPIKRETIERKYIQLAPEDEEGFVAYMRSGLRLAAQMPGSFSIKGMHGKPGDYLVLGGESG